MSDQYTMNNVKWKIYKIQTEQKRETLHAKRSFADTQTQAEPTPIIFYIRKKVIYF